MTGPFDPVAVGKIMAAHGHSGFVGLRYVAHGDDWAEIAFDPRPELMADPENGILASAPIITLMDVATGFSILVKLGRLEPQATMDIRVDYLRPARAGRAVHGRGECYRITRNVAFVRGLAHDGDPADPVAHVAGTFMFTGDRP